MQKRQCKQCKQMFQFRACPTDIKSGRGKYCSNKCKADRLIKLPRFYPCQLCGRNKHNLYGKIKKFCSKECADKSRIGLASWNKGLKTPEEIRKKLSEAHKGKYFGPRKYKNDKERKEAEKAQSRASYRRNKHKYINHYRAGSAVGKALKKGLIVRMPCEICQEKKVEAHHYKGYAKENWLDIKWLCKQHHEDAHHKKHQAL